VTEVEWEASDTLWAMSAQDLIGLFKTSHRKFFNFLALFLPRLLPENGCGVCRASLQLFEGQPDRGWSVDGWWTVLRAEHPGNFSQRQCQSREWFRLTIHYLEGLLTQVELWNKLVDFGTHVYWHIYRHSHATHLKIVFREGHRAVKEVLGNPFRPATIASTWLSWNDALIPKLAQTIHDERRFEDLPILADALEDAGCDQEAVLMHCRSVGEHARGCWVLGLLLGKE
jgi:hypothetical protein